MDHWLENNLLTSHMLLQEGSILSAEQGPFMDRENL